MGSRTGARSSSEERLLEGESTQIWRPWGNTQRVIPYAALSRRAPTEVQKLLTLTLALFFGLLCTSVELFVAETTLLRSTPVISVVKVFAWYVLWATRTTKYRTGTCTVNGNPSADQNRDVL